MNSALSLPQVLYREKLIWKGEAKQLCSQTSQLQSWNSFSYAGRTTHLVSNLVKLGVLSAECEVRSLLPLNRLRIIKYLRNCNKLLW